MKKILIIKHGSLGDIISATSVVKDIRTHFNKDKVFIMTTSKFENFFLDSNLINEVLVDNRKGIFSIFNLINKILSYKFDLIIDLQNSQRTSFYILFIRFFSKIKVNGTTFFCNIRYKNTHDVLPSVIDGLSNQIELLKINTRRKPFLDWLDDTTIKIEDILKKNFVIINPGCSKKSIQKKWPSEYYANICTYLLKKNILPVLIGSNEDKEAINEIIKIEERVLNLINESPLGVIYKLAQKAIGTLSNDTGPAHLIAATGCKIHLVLSDFSNVKTVIPQGRNISFTQKKNIKQISVKEIIKEIEVIFKI